MRTWTAIPKHLSMVTLFLQVYHLQYMAASCKKLGGERMNEVTFSPTQVSFVVSSIRTPTWALTIRDGLKHIRLRFCLQVPSGRFSLFLQVLFCGVHVKDFTLTGICPCFTSMYNCVDHARRKSLSQQGVPEGTEWRGAPSINYISYICTCERKSVLSGPNSVVRD